MGNEQTTPLMQLALHEDALVIDLGATPSASRLMAMGLFPGVPVRLLSRGASCLLRAGRTRLCLRSEDLATVLVERCS